MTHMIRKHTRTLRRATVALAAAITMGLGTTTAHADPGIPDIGYGYANVPESVRCVQFFVNNYLDLHLPVDGEFGPQTKLGVEKLQKYATFHWGIAPLAIDGIFGKNTGDAVLTHIKRFPTSIDYTKALHCSRYVPSHSVILT